MPYVSTSLTWIRRQMKSVNVSRISLHFSRLTTVYDARTPISTQTGHAMAGRVLRVALRVASLRLGPMFVHRPLAPLLLLKLHPTVLKPNFNLPLGQVQQRCHLDPSRAAQVAIEVELFF